MKRLGIVSTLVVILLVSTSCASGVPQEAYDRIQNELSTIEGELATLQGKLAESEALQALNDELGNELEKVKGQYEAAQAEYDKLSAELDELNIKYDTMQSEYETLQAKYEELSAEYEDLTITEEEEIIEEDIEQALFELINQDRIDYGLDVLAWRESLYQLVKKNSIDMATNKELQYPEYDVTWRAVYWVAGHNSAGEIAEATHLVWKNRDTYETYFLYVYLDFGAVGVHKSGDLFYITYVGGQFR